MADFKKQAGECANVAGIRALVPALEGPFPIVIDLFLLCYVPSPLFHAHWSIFIPEQANSQRGTVINVRGDPLDGFVHEFDRGYVPSEDSDRPLLMTKLGSVKDTIVGPFSSLEPGKDTIAQTELERLALTIPAPGPSLRRSASRGGRVRVEIRDCQWWVGQFVARMVESEILDPGALGVLDQAPRH